MFPRTRKITCPSLRIETYASILASGIYYPRHMLLYMIALVKDLRYITPNWIYHHANPIF